MRQSVGEEKQSHLLYESSAISFSCRVFGNEGSFFVAFLTLLWVLEYPFVTDLAARTVFFVRFPPTTIAFRAD